MDIINTVSGPLSPEDMGRTLMHEHFLYGYCGYQGDATLGGFKEEEYTRACVTACEDARAYGIRTIVDATTNECGRNVRFLRHIADLTGMNIICSTGFYYEGETSYAYWNFRRSFANIEDEIYDMYMTELTKGIEDTGMKAGVIKLGTSKGVITPTEEIFLKAAGRAQHESGCVVITHTQEGTMGPEQAELLIASGADPKKVAIGHMCGNTDLSYHEKVLKQGVSINMDRFGLQGELFHTPTDEERMDVIASLCERGWEKKILLGHDSVNVNLGRGNIMNDFMKEALKDANIRTIGWKVLPGLAERGLSEEQIDGFLTDNPRTLFS